MAINLKQILLSDTDNIKLEKVNYNFDQIVANGGGPQGVVGDPGAMGYQGVTGYQGDQGIPGEQGFQGADGDSGELVWKENLGSASKTILPIHDALTTPNAPTIAIGYKSNSQFYINEVEESTSLLINKDDVLQNNLELRTEGSLDAFYYRLRTDNSIHTMQTGFKLSSGTAVLNQYASEWNWISETTQNTLITLDSTKLQVDIESEFNEPVSINNTLKISGTNSGAAVDKIAISTDADGTIDFKSIDEIGGVVPIGTIVSVDPAFFNSSNFKLTETNVTAPSDAPIEIRVGSGINNFAGWYLCNGQTWSNGLDPATIGYIGYQTEDLNSFSYSIDENPATIDPDSQGEVNVTNNSVPLIGGADVAMAATYSAPNYNISGTVQTSSQPISSDSGGTTFILKRLPQIIYLGAEDLFWQDKGTNQAAPVSVTYTFIDSNETASGAVTINESKTQVEGSSFSFTVNVPATSGYQWDSLPTVTSTDAVITSVTSSNPSGSLPTSNININVNVGSQPQGGTVTINYDSTSNISVIPLPTFAFSDWTGDSVFIDYEGNNVTSWNSGNADFTPLPSILSPGPGTNPNAGTRTIATNIAIVVPSGYSNSGGIVSGSVQSTQAGNPTVNQAPDAPTNFAQFTGFYPNSPQPAFVTLNWDAPSLPSGASSLYYRVSGSCPPPAASVTGLSTVSNTNITDTNVFFEGLVDDTWQFTLTAYAVFPSGTSPRASAPVQLIGIDPETGMT